MEYAYDYPNRRLAARIHNEYPNSYERFMLNFNQVYQSSKIHVQMFCLMITANLWDH